MSRLTSCARLGILIPLAACGAASEGFDPVALNAGQSAVLSAADMATFAAANAAPQTTGLPTGTVNYTGTFTGRTVIAGRNDQTMTGDMAMSAGFGTGDITGSITNFSGEDISGRSQAFQGALALDGEVERSGDNGRAVMMATGTLTDGTRNDVQYDLDLEGDFRGPNAAYVLGTATGDITATNRSGLSVQAAFTNGGFVAER